jgi:glycosyltransferase involved in cell wall biosynthesis
MRIGMVTACYKPVVNGVTRMIELYKQRLEELGHEVTVFTLGEPDPAGEEPGVVRSPGIPVSEGYYVGMRYTHEAQDLLGEMDIIHCHHLFMSVEMAHRYGRSPIVYTNHTRYDLYTGSYMPLPQPAADALMRQIWPEFSDFADVVITPSESVRRVMLDFGVRRPIEVIENGVDLRPFRNPPNPFSKQDLDIPQSAILFTYVGRLSPEKDLDLLLRQFSIARDIAPDIHLMIIGKGPSAKELSIQVRQMGIEKYVHFMGVVDYESVGNYLAAADVFTTASISEVHPLTLIEAMAAGLPVAAVASPGIADTVESGRSGYLTNQPDGGLAAAMVGLAVDNKRRWQMGLAAQQASERFDIIHTVAKTVELYERLRAARPDLMRKRKHGRWVRNQARMEPLVEQLARLLKPTEKLGTGPLRRFIVESMGEQDNLD